MPVMLVVGGLSRSTSSRCLRRFFADAGSVRSASVVMHRDTGRSHGFGFVEMATAGQANDARARLNGGELDGSRIVVDVARPEIWGGGGGQRGRGAIDPGAATRGVEIRAHGLSSSSRDAPPTQRGTSGR